MKICLGISGSIASYRSVDLVKKLVSAGHQVRCVLTKGGAQFVSSRVLETFSGHPVQSDDVFDASHFSTDHIAMARWADAFIVYGASANFMGRLSAAIADDFLNLQLLAFEGPVILVPAMNPSMWKNPLVESAREKLAQAGYRFCGPISGKVACGEEGVGHVASDEDIINLLQPGEKRFSPKLSGKKILISAGPMQTQLDPVRFIQNRSSGKMGYSIAKACKDAGAKVHVLLGPVSETMAERYQALCEVTRYQGPGDYQKALNHLFEEADVFFSAAAVLDFESLPVAQKIERSALNEMKKLSLDIRAVPDLVSHAAARKKQSQMVVAFAAETGSESEILVRAQKKMTRKSADFMIANPVWEGLGPDSDENLIWVLGPHQAVKKIGPALKEELGPMIIEAIF